MKFKELIKNLKDVDYIIYDEVNPDEEILGVKYQQDVPLNIAPDFLYYISEENFSKIEYNSKLPVNFAVWGCKDTKKFYDNISPGNNIILIPGKNHINAFNQLVEPFLIEQKYNVCVKQLSDALLSDKGIQNLTEKAYTILKKPILVTDTTYKYLAKSFSKDVLPEGSKLLKYFEEIEEENVDYLPKESINYLWENKLQEKLANSDKVLHHKNKLTNSNVMAVGIRVKNTVVGYVFMFEVDMPFSYNDERLLINFRDLVSQEMQKDTLYHSNRDEYMAYLLLDLLTNKYPDEKTIRKRLETVDFTPGNKLQMLVIRQHDNENAGCSMNIIASQLQHVLRGHMYAKIDNTLAILLSFSSADKKLDGYLLEQIEKVCQTNNLIAGVSNEFSDLTLLDRQYRLANRAALLARRYGREKRIEYYDDVADIAFLELLDRYENAMDYVHSAVIRLMEYDKKYGTNYLYTFWMYSENAFNTQLTAKKMFIHKNTLAYRLSKIKEILNTNLSTGKEMFVFQLSLRILMMLGKIENKDQ